MLDLFVWESVSDEKISATIVETAEHDLIETQDWQTSWTTPFVRQLSNKVALRRLDNDELLGLSRPAFLLPVLVADRYIH